MKEPTASRRIDQRVRQKNCKIFGYVYRYSYPFTQEQLEMQGAYRNMNKSKKKRAAKAARASGRMPTGGMAAASGDSPSPQKQLATTTLITPADESIVQTVECVREAKDTVTPDEAEELSGSDNVNELAERLEAVGVDDGEPEKKKEKERVRQVVLGLRRAAQDRLEAERQACMAAESKENAISEHMQEISSGRPFGLDMDSNVDDPVAIQKKRAAALWHTVCRALKIPNDNVDTVFKRLELGLVPPVFHAYVALFQRMGGAKKLQQDKMASASENEMISQGLEKLPSMNFVTNGTAPSSQMGKIKGKTKGFMGAFFTEKGEARDEVQDGYNLIWSFDPDSTEAVCKLINAEAEMIGADVEITKVDSDFGIGEADDATATHLITRRLSRGVIAEALSMHAKKTRAIVGCPGIGKSWSLIYALQQLLLQDGACVLFFAAKDDVALACIREKDKVFVWTCGTERACSYLFSSENVWALVDPKEAKQQSTSMAAGNRRLLFAASSNEKHFASDMGKRSSHPFYYLDPYTEEELRVALPVMSSKVLDGRMMDWASKIGMLPRYLVSKGQYEQRLSLFDNFVKKLDNDGLKKIVASEGISTGENDLPGTIFAIRAAQDVDDDNELLPIGYDGESGVVYTQRSLSVISDYVWNEITKQNRDYILSFWGVVDSFEFAKQGFEAEILLASELQKKALFRTWDMKLQKFVMSPAYPKGPQRFLGGRKIAHLKETFDRDDMVVRMVQGCALIDFAGPGRKVFHVTVSDDHDMKLNAAEELLTVAGYLKLDASGNYEPVPDDDDSSHKPKLDFYWVIPYGRFMKWKGYAPKKLLNKGRNAVMAKRRKVVTKTLETYINQYVLIMDRESPSAQDLKTLLGSQLPWQGMEVVITGKFKDMLQQDVELMVMQLGATIKAEVGQLTAYVIEGTFQAGPKVLAEAKALKKVILDLDNFLNIFDEYFNTKEASTPG
jgi:hypothetical protein